MKRSSIILLILLAAAVVGAGVMASLKGVQVETSPTRQGPIEQYVDEQGKTRLPITYRITMPLTGRIEEIRLREGDPVTAGQVVAQIVPEDLNNAVAEAQAVVERLDAAIRENDDVRVEETTRQQADLFVESMAHTVAAAEARQESGKARFEFAESHLGRMRDLFRQGAQAQEEAEKAEADYVAAQVEYRQDVLVYQAVKAIEAATKLLPKIVTQQIERKDLARAVLEKQKSEAEVRLRQATIDRQRGTMTSPVDGVVLGRNETNERLLNGGTLLMEIGRMRDLEVEADILSREVIDVQPGDRVIIYGPAVGRDVDRGIVGRVDRIYPAGFTKVSSLGVEQQRVKVIIHFDAEQFAQLQTERPVGVDYSVRVRIITDEKGSALIVPRSALFRGGDGSYQVFVVRGGRAVLQNVHVGLMNDAEVEIVEGLKAGEPVILAPGSRLQNGTRVEMSQEK